MTNIKQQIVDAIMHNPELPIKVFTDEEIASGDYGTLCVGNIRKVEITDIYEYEGMFYTDEGDLEDAIEYDFDCGETINIDKVFRECKEKAKKSIILYVGV